MAVPVKPTAADHHSEHHVRLHERVLEGRGLLIAGGGITISVNADGQYIISATNRPAPASAAAGTGWNYRGTYDPAAAYMAFDVVVYGAGTASGLYLSMVDNPTTAPDSGIGWVQLSTASGNWL